jgi:hypothetical protein
LKKGIYRKEIVYSKKTDLGAFGHRGKEQQQQPQNGQIITDIFQIFLVPLKTALD